LPLSRRHLVVLALAALGALVLLAAMGAGARSATGPPLSPVADSYVRADQPNANFGSATSLRLDADPALKAYLRFNVQNLTGAVTHAVLRVRSSSTNSVGYRVSGVSSTTWGEGTITHANAPAIAPTPVGSSGPLSAGEFSEVDVTALVQGNGLVSMALTTTSGTAMTLSSSEAATGSRPQLVITTGPSDTAAPSVPSGLVAVANGQNRIDLDWSPSTDNVGVADYGIYRDGSSTPVATTAATSFSDTGLASGSTHSYRVDAVDAAGNRSARTASVSATTAGGGGGGGTESFEPVADSYVRADQPNANFGSAPSMRLDASPLLRSYLRFDVQNITGAVTRAVLRVRATSTNSAGYRVSAVSSTTWGEGTITHVNAPAIAATPVGSSGPVTSGQFSEVDVTGLVQGDGLVSMALTTTSATAMGLSSSEAAAGRRPQLVITTGEPPPDGPIRAAFYYPWFPNAWTQKGVFPFTQYEPVLGFYDLDDDDVTIAKHVDAMQYGNIQAGISSWWGPVASGGDYTDSRLDNLLAVGAEKGFFWTVYYEDEAALNPTAARISSDLTYIRDRYMDSPAWLRKDGRPVVFVYAGDSDGCAMATRWKQGNTIGAYLVLKVFVGYAACADQPDAWHQYAPSQPDGVDVQNGFSHAISPGFWYATESTPRAARNFTQWQANVAAMAAADEPWHLITTFNEWGEGTSVEEAVEWETADHGEYLEVLHDNPTAAP
jgi:chitodextrinase